MDFMEPQNLKKLWVLKKFTQLWNMHQVCFLPERSGRIWPWDPALKISLKMELIA